MPSPIPKPAHLRQRRNKTPGAATLPTPESSSENEVPPLPEREGGWHPMVTEWWAAAWRSPMASEWLESDKRGGLYQVAVLHQDFWEADTRGGRLAAAAEIRLQEVRFGLSPIDRRRLQWEVDKGETAAEKTAARKARNPPKQPAEDPRDVLKAI